MIRNNRYSIMSCNLHFKKWKICLPSEHLKKKKKIVKDPVLISKELCGGFTY